MQGRQLVTQRLARAGWHDGKRVPSLQGGADHFFLPGAEFFEAEHALQRAAQGRHIGCASHGVRTKQPSCRDRRTAVSRRSHESRSDPARSSRARRGACGRTIHFAFMPRRPFPPAVWLLGWVSLLTDAASEAIYPLLPFFLTTVLGGGPVALGIIEGVAEGTNSLLRIVSGRLSDRSRWRRGLVIAGYTLSSAARPFVAVVSAWWQVLVIRFTDRIGKGVRSAPRDALLAFWADPSSRGRVYGFHRAMDHAGAVIGPLLASAFL